MSGAPHRCRARGAGLIALFALAFGVAAGAAQAGARDLETARWTKLDRLYYADVRDGSSPRYHLAAYAKRADSLRFTISHDGDRANAPGLFRDDKRVDTREKDKADEWVVDRENGGRRVLRLIRAALEERGAARVVVRMRGFHARAKIVVVIVRAECNVDPPSYPLTCIVEP
ncbi:MAG: hypothetical protein GEU88_02125 [Solirubrobacterales bacterium]|nr:hypothetical protein [Solirubrobacterales bacterium]